MNHIEKFKNYFAVAIVGLLAIFAYFFLSGIEILPFELAGVDIWGVPNYIKIFYLIIYEIFMMAVMGLIFNKKLVKDFKDIKVNHKKYYGENIKYWLIGLAIMGISNIFIGFVLKGGIAANEEAVREVFAVSPIYIYLSAIIYAPFVEELVFRQGIKNLIPNKYLFIIISGLGFGGLHVFGSVNNLVDLAYLIPYSSLGIVFAIMLHKTNNIFTSMGFHFLHNGLFISIQFLVLLFS